MRILEISGSPRAAFAGMILAEMGAEVVKVERPDESPLPEYTDQFVSRRKFSIEVAMEDPILHGLIGKADAILQDSAQLSYQTMRGLNENIVLATISPYGLTGPKSDWLATELTMQASSGLLQSTGWIDEAPTRLPGHTAEYIAGLNAAIAVLAAIYEGKGADLDISAQECTIQHLTRHIAQWSHTGTEITRYVRDLKGQASPLPVEARDGWIYFLALRPGWAEMAEFSGIPEYAGDEWSDLDTRLEHWDEIGAAFEGAVAGKDKYTWFAEGAARGYTFAPIDSITEILQSPQMKARGFFTEARSSDQRFQAPSLPFSFESDSVRDNRTTTPGGDRDYILRRWLGVDIPELEITGS